MTTHVVHWSYTPDKSVMEASRAEHLAYVKQLVSDGKLLEAGPFEDETGALLIFRLESAAELIELLQRDPYTSGGVVTDTRIYDWRPVLGPLS
ncbi:YciI family protein [Pseudarthrobacter sp. ATCC 49987]|uniref:YciI family protein n=1 Tax=Pseudarthrobacter sp. ATCC 49987 TaxID=2698204 RepID=UPI00136AA01A|nr:muconolactone Delta-isomerase family protein [Pseudarthrobacter sp. ATCC 49987]